MLLIKKTSLIGCDKTGANLHQCKDVTRFHMDETLNNIAYIPDGNLIIG